MDGCNMSRLEDAIPRWESEVALLTCLLNATGHMSRVDRRSVSHREETEVTT
jgi:hypothetical protein